MSGEEESKTQTIDERYQQLQLLLKNYPSKIGLGVLQPINDTERYLTMSEQERRRMTAEECGNAAITLNQAATYIQLETNKMQAEIRWCDRYIDWLIASKITEAGSKYTPFEYRRILAIRNNDVATKLQQIMANIQLRIDSLSYIPTQLRATAASYSDLQQTKRSQKA